MKTRSVLFMLALFITGISAQAQSKHQHPHHRKGPGLFGAIENTKADLNLTKDQEAQLDELKASFDQEMQTLKDQKVENKENHRQAAKALHEDYRSQINTVLTKEQLTVLKEKRKASSEERHNKMDKADKKKLKTELRAYYNDNIKPVMLEERKAFDAKISASDKEELAGLRTRLAAKKEARKQEHKEHKSKQEGSPHNMKHKRHPKMDENNPDHQALKALVDKYDTGIEAALMNLKPAHEKWDAERQVIINKYLPEVGKDKKHGFHGHGPKGKTPGMRKNHFLLLDPNGTDTDQVVLTSAIENAKAFPNPASNQLTLSYSLLMDGEVIVEWQNDQGQSAQVLENTFKPAGDYEMTIDVSNYRDGIHYINLICNGQRTVVKALIAKQ